MSTPPMGLHSAVYSVSHVEIPKTHKMFGAQKKSPPESQDGALYDMMSLDMRLYEALAGVMSKVSMCTRTREELGSADARTTRLLRAFDVTIPPTQV